MSAPDDHSSPILQALLQVTGGSRHAVADAGFCGEGQLPLAALSVEVRGHGRLAQPLDFAQALHRSSTPARYGQREQTLLDRAVRDTGEISPERVTLHWEAQAQRILQAEVARSLGLPAVRLALHNLLVYGPGQFFKPHQDTEKHEGMLGTLVLVWPSPHIGGQLQVRHGRGQHDFASQHLHAPNLRWMAFYADCRHEVLPVSEGWRLALAEIHEVWTAVYDRQDNPEPDELIDDSLRLDFWVDGDGCVGRGASLDVSLADAVGFSETDEAFLVGEEHEGYMGNYGDTVDYWYRRAALVLQTPWGAEGSRFVIDFDAALADALTLAHRGDVQLLTPRLRVAAAALVRRSRQGDGHGLWPAYAELALALPDSEQALDLCRHFDWTRFGRSDARALAQLEGRHGSGWVQRLLRAWTQTDGNPRVYPEADRLWPAALPAFVRMSREQGLSPLALWALLVAGLDLLVARDARQVRRAPAERQRDQVRRLDLVCELATAMQALAAPPDWLPALLRHVRQQPALYPLLQLRPLLQALSAAADRAAEVVDLHAAVVQALRRALQQPLPAEDDHTLPDIEWTCHCNDCQPVMTWAVSASGKPLTLAMAKPRREHVQEQLQRAAAPLSAETVKQGSPHQLVLRKPTDLHAARLARRQQWRDDLAALACA